MVPDSVFMLEVTFLSTFFAWVQNNNINMKYSAVKTTLNIIINVINLIFDVLLYTKYYNIPICKST